MSEKLNLRDGAPLFLICMLPLLFTTYAAQAEIDLHDLLTNDAVESDTLVSFLSAPGMSYPISAIHIHYLASSNCYSGYAGGFYSHYRKNVYSTEENIPFMLNGKYTYIVGKSVVKNIQMDEIHGILIRLVRDVQEPSGFRFAFFIGDCNDQDINCCIPVSCSSETEVCLPDHQFPIQYIFWQ